jgi:hypothetical protein
MRSKSSRLHFGYTPEKSSYFNADEMLSLPDDTDYQDLDTDDNDLREDMLKKMFFSMLRQRRRQEEVKLAEKYDRIKEMFEMSPEELDRLMELANTTYANELEEMKLKKVKPSASLVNKYPLRYEEAEHPETKKKAFYARCKNGQVRRLVNGIFRCVDNTVASKLDQGIDIKKPNESVFNPDEYETVEVFDSAGNSRGFKTYKRCEPGKERNPRVPVLTKRGSMTYPCVSVGSSGTKKRTSRSKKTREKCEEDPEYEWDYENCYKKCKPGKRRGIVSRRCVTEQQYQHELKNKEIYENEPVSIGPLDSGRCPDNYECVRKCGADEERNSSGRCIKRRTSGSSTGEVKPLNSFMKYYVTERANVVRDYPHLRGNDITKKAGELWRALPKERQQYYANLPIKTKAEIAYEAGLGSGSGSEYVPLNSGLSTDIARSRSRSNSASSSGSGSSPYEGGEDLVVEL